MFLNLIDSKSDWPRLVTRCTCKTIYAYRVMLGEESEKPLYVLQPGQMGDLELKRSQRNYGVKIANVPIRTDFSRGINWGYLGVGPHALSLSVLFHYSGGDEAFAKAWCSDFVEKVISLLPMDSDLVVDRDFILRFVSWAKEQKAKEVKTVFHQFLAVGQVYDEKGHVVREPAFLE